MFWTVYIYFNTLSCQNYFFQRVWGVYKRGGGFILVVKNGNSRVGGGGGGLM